MWKFRNSKRIIKKRCRNKSLKCIILYKQDDGNTAVHLAMAYGHYKIADLLIEAGGSTHITNKSGQTAWALI